MLTDPVRCVAMELVDLEPNDVRLADVWPVLQWLRDQLAIADLEARYASGYPDGYRLTAGYDDRRCVAVAGWRIITTFAHGRFLYVDDLVVDPQDRSRGYGAELLAALEARAGEAGCETIRLDSGVQRHQAHRFYFREGYHIASYAFAKELGN